MSSHAKALPKNLIARLSRAGSQGEQGFGGLLTLILCAQKLALGNSVVVATGEGEERSRVASVLWCRMDEGNGTPYIVTQVLRFVEPGHHQSHLGDAVMAINYTFNRTINCCQRQNSHHAAPHRTCTSRPAAHAHAHAYRPSGRPSVRAAPRLGLGLGLGHGPARPGAARRASARACGSPSSSYRLHKWCTRSPPFKSVEILLNSLYGIKH